MKTFILMFVGSVFMSAAATGAAPDAAPDDVEAPKHAAPKIAYSPPLKREGAGLATVGYAPLPEEKAFLKKVNERPIALWPGDTSDTPEKGKELKPIASKDYRLVSADGRYVGWFAIVRGVSTKEGETTLLLEHKYFDGLCDAHLQLVSLFGAGDFTASFPKAKDEIPRLSLVCVYGPAKKAPNGGVTVSPEFIRVWKQPLFAFMDYGDDHSNAKWTVLRKVRGPEIYSPRPNREYYDRRLGPSE